MRISDWSSDVCSSDLSLPVKISFSEDSLMMSIKCSVEPTALCILAYKSGIEPTDAPSITVNMRNEKKFCCPSSPSRSEEHTSELQSLMRISYAVFCLKKKNITNIK